MGFFIALKWGGFHGHVVVRQPDGKVLYVLQAWWPRLLPFSVVDASGSEVLRVHRKLRFPGTAYQIRSDGQTVAEAGTNWSWSQGWVRLPDHSELRCRYGWGIKKTLEFENTGITDARISLQNKMVVEGLLELEDPSLNTPPFLIACALVFRDWTSRD